MQRKQCGEQMQNDGWWWTSPVLTNKAIKRDFLRDMITVSFPTMAPAIKIFLPSLLINQPYSAVITTTKKVNES